MTSITLSLVFLPMIKTNTKKKSSPKKTPAVAAKAPVAKKVAPAKKTPVKSVSPKKTTSPKKVTPTKTPIKSATSSKKTVPAMVKKIAPKKAVSQSPASSQTKTESHTATKSTVTNVPKEGVKMLGVLHLVGNILSGGALGIILVIIYYFFQHEKLSRVEKETCFEIINFNLSFILYMWVAVGLIFALIGIVLIPVVWLTWFVLLILWFLSHLVGDNYRYPLTIRFVS